MKRKARQKIQKVIKSFSEVERQAKSLAACENVCRLPEFDKASVVMMFLSLPEEVDTARAILTAFQEDKTVLVPSVVWEGRHIIPLTIESLDCEMKHDDHGLRHPKHGEPMPASEIDLVIVPGIGFDDQGNRLGRGGGFYDRFLSRDGFRGVTCGLAFEEQVVKEVPVAEHDIQLDLLVTDGLVRRFVSQ